MPGIVIANLISHRGQRCSSLLFFLSSLRLTAPRTTYSHVSVGFVLRLVHRSPYLENTIAGQLRAFLAHERNCIDNVAQIIVAGNLSQFVVQLP